MNRKVYIGITALIVIFSSAMIFMFIKNQNEINQLKQELAESESPIITSDKPIKKDDLPAADPGFKWIPHDDHFHQVPIDAPDEWQGEPHAPSMPIDTPVRFTIDLSQIASVEDVHAIPIPTSNDMKDWSYDELLQVHNLSRLILEKSTSMNDIDVNISYALGLKSQKFRKAVSREMDMRMDKVMNELRKIGGLSKEGVNIPERLLSTFSHYEKFDPREVGNK